MSSSAREEIIGTIRAALGRGLSFEPKPVGSSLAATGPIELPDRGDFDLVKRFESELTRVGGRYYHAASAELACAYVAQVAAEQQAKTIIGWQTLVPDAIELKSHLEQKGLQFRTEIGEGQIVRDVAHADIGVTGVDYALAETGSLVLLADKGRARSVSLLPPVHIAFVKRVQIISGFDDLFAALLRDRPAKVRDLSSAVTFITGPSRTADIELTLVVGVHGPQQLHVVLLDNQARKHPEPDTTPSRNHS
ncbi:MAG TPA: lactate utilization protein [Blastocatellia bacterium]|nr:lactate utilization protein [Blastocatellia bacterium]